MPVMRISLSFKNDAKVTPKAGPCTAPSHWLDTLQQPSKFRRALAVLGAAGTLPARCLRQSRHSTGLLLLGLYLCNTAAAEAQGKDTWLRVGISEKCFDTIR